MTTEDWSSASLSSLKKPELLSSANKLNTSDDEDGALARRKERIKRRKRNKNNNNNNNNVIVALNGNTLVDSEATSGDKVIDEESNESLFEEDIVEGFSFVACHTFEQLELVSRWSEKHGGKLPDPHARLDACDDPGDFKDPKENKGGKKKKRKRRKQQVDQEEDQQLKPQPKECISSPKQNASATTNNNHHHMVVAGGDSSSEKGYLCDSDSDDDKGSDNGIGDLFTTKKACPNGLSQSSTPLSESTATTPVSSTNVGMEPAMMATKASTTTTTSMASSIASSSQPSLRRNVLYRPYSTSPPPTRPATSMPISSLTSASLTANSTTTSATRAPMPSSWSSSVLSADAKCPSLSDLNSMASIVSSPRLHSHLFQPRMPNQVVDGLGHTLPPLTPSLGSGSTTTQTTLYNNSHPLFRHTANKHGAVDAPKLFPPALPSSLGSPPSKSEATSTTTTSTSSSSSVLSRSQTNGSSFLSPSSCLKKGGKWNAMHVRIAWEIYNHQRKTKGKDGTPSTSLMSKNPSLTRSSGASPRTTTTSSNPLVKDSSSPLLTPRTPNPPRLNAGGVTPDLLRNQFGLLPPPAAAMAFVPKHFPPVPTASTHFPPPLDPLSRLPAPPLAPVAASVPLSAGSPSSTSPFGGLGNLRGTMDDVARRQADRDRARRQHMEKKNSLSNGHRSRSPRRSPAIMDKKMGGGHNALDMRLYNGSTNNGNEVSLVSEKEGNVTICHDATSANKRSSSVSSSNGSKRHKMSPHDSLPGIAKTSNSGLVGGTNVPPGASSMAVGNASSRPSSVADPFTAMLTSLFGAKTTRDRPETSTTPRFPSLASMPPPMSAPFMSSPAPAPPPPPLNSASGLLGSMANKLLPQPPSSLFLYNGLAPPPPPTALPPVPYALPAGLLPPPAPPAGRLATTLPGAASVASQPLFNPFPPR